MNGSLDVKNGSNFPGVSRFRTDASGTPSARKWTTRVLRGDDEFKALGRQWSSLLGECDGSNVFQSHEWLYTWWITYRPEAELTIVVAERSGKVGGIAPVMLETTRRGGVTVRVLRFVGDGTHETDHMDFLASRTDRRAILQALLEGVSALDWDIAELNQVPEASPNARDLMEWIGKSGLWRFVKISPCPVCQLPANFQGLLSALPSRLRTSIRSSRRKLAQRSVVAFGVCKDEEELSTELAAFFCNHESRWRGKGATGVFADARRREFYARLSPKLLEKGWLRLFFLRLDGRSVAHQYCFTTGDTVMLLQEGFDFSLASENIGNTLRSYVFEHLIDTKVSTYDFLAGASRHKQNWSNGVVNDLCIHCARPSWRGVFFYLVPRLIERARDVLGTLRDRVYAVLRERGWPPSLGTRNASGAPDGT